MSKNARQQLIEVSNSISMQPFFKSIYIYIYYPMYRHSVATRPTKNKRSIICTIHANLQKAHINLGITTKRGIGILCMKNVRCQANKKNLLILSTFPKNTKLFNISDGQSLFDGRHFFKLQPYILPASAARLPTDKQVLTGNKSTCEFGTKRKVKLPANKKYEAAPTQRVLE